MAEARGNFEGREDGSFWVIARGAPSSVYEDSSGRDAHAHWSDITLKRPPNSGRYLIEWFREISTAAKAVQATASTTAKFWFRYPPIPSNPQTVFHVDISHLNNYVVFS